MWWRANLFLILVFFLSESDFSYLYDIPYFMRKFRKTKIVILFLGYMATCYAAKALDVNTMGVELEEPSQIGPLVPLVP